ncbi:MAG: ammonia-forming cytochrome c nitrite reductase subunit c552 [Armatimonadota bacterium]
MTRELAQGELLPQDQAIEVGGKRYRADVAELCVWEDGPDGRRSLPMEHALGGKNVYYFLTPLPRGRLQVLPVAFDVRRRQWFDTTGSMVRHFADVEDEALDWTDPLLTFNTACHSCHVSQLQKNYDLKTDTYHTTWQEPGINCETCHGPASEHVRVCREALGGETPDDLKLISMTDLTPTQRDDTCAPCHAKMRPLTQSFRPGERFFDHYNLSTLEDRDFYPDGRDLGENYTYTLWRMNPCAESGELECLHCHTPSGRYRFAETEANDACLPCHEERVADAAEHTHHPADSEGSTCIGCHMPMTAFGRMKRSDHSLRPPMPAASLRFGSPNACTLCHTDRDDRWADRHVRKWYERDYQAATLHAGELVLAARNREWERLPEMLGYLRGDSGDEVFAASVIRLLGACDHPGKRPALLEALRDPSPLVRSAAATTLAGDPDPRTLEALLEAADDAYRVVRVAAGAALAPWPDSALDSAGEGRHTRALAEYEASLRSQPDSWTAHYNLGNYYADRGDQRRALDAFETATRLRPDVVPPLVNAALAHARLGEMAESETLLRKALAVEPASPAANFNLALALAENGDAAGAEKHLRVALGSDPTMAEAAYNLGVLLAEERLPEALEWCRKAAALRPREAKYGYTYAFYLRKSGNVHAAIEQLNRLLDAGTSDARTYTLLAAIYEEEGRTRKSREVCRRASADMALSESERARFGKKAAELSR